MFAGDIEMHRSRPGGCIPAKVLDHIAVGADAGCRSVERLGYGELKVSGPLRRNSESPTANCEQHVVQCEAENDVIALDAHKDISLPLPPSGEVIVLAGSAAAFDGCRRGAAVVTTSWSVASDMDDGDVGARAEDWITPQPRAT